MAEKTTGFYIESKPLTKEQAILINSMLARATITADMAEKVLAARVALDRISSGQDIVSDESSPTNSIKQDSNMKN